jgi:hypothetical protein
MQQNPPDRDTVGGQVPDLSGTTPQAPSSWGPFTDAEWKTLVAAPVKVGRAMIAVAPSGGIGMAKEVSALRKGLTEAIQQSSNPMLKQLGLHAHAEGGMESLWKQVGQAFGDRWDSQNVRQTAIAACQEVVAILKKAAPQDAQAYKECLYSSAQRVSEAGKEGGFIGIGGGRLSETETSLLNDVANTLRLQRT